MTELASQYARAAEMSALCHIIPTATGAAQQVHIMDGNAAPAARIVAPHPTNR